MRRHIWRVQGVPRSFDEETLSQALRTHPELQCRAVEDAAGHLSGNRHDHSGDNGVVVHTITLDLRRDLTKVATVSFRELPQRLRDITKVRSLTLHLAVHTSSPMVGDKRKRGHLQEAKVEVDDRFDDLTVLYSPSERHDFDILALSGLGGHPFGSFADKDGHMWLADSLPEDLSHARVIVYGCHTPLLDSTSFAALGSLTSSFYNALCRILESDARRPIVLVGHSLGGLLIKDCLFMLSKSAVKHLLPLVAACLFFGVPNDGMKVDSLKPLVGNQPNRLLLESLRIEDSDFLTDQKRKFTEVLNQHEIELVCFFETEFSPTPREVRALRRVRR